MPVTQVRKRDGRVVPFDAEKIAEAIYKAASSVGGSDMDLARSLAHKVKSQLSLKQFKEGTPSVEDVQDMVEYALIEDGHAKTAKAYILYRQKRKEYREAKALMGIPQDSLKMSINSLKVLEKRYLLRDSTGKVIESPEGLFRRVAKALSSVEKQYGMSDEDVAKVEEEFYKMISSLDFLPNSPTLMNAGTKMGQLSACFVLPVEDNMSEIFESLKHQALIHQTGGGTGFSFSRLRPRGDLVGSTKGVASGPVSFMTLFDAATAVVKQGGKRRGANMGILRVDHPDIMEFITLKDSNNSILSNFNISVAITDEFMKALEEDRDYALINPRNQQVNGYMNAKKVWDILVTHAWKSGDPGVVFIDRINTLNPTNNVGLIEATNPCVAEGTLVNTPNGYVPVENINIGDMISTVYGNEPVKSIETHENTPVFKVKFSDGGEQLVTAAHRYYAIKKGSQSKKLGDVRLDQLQPGDYVRVEPSALLKSSPEDYSRGLKTGILLGDGCYTDDMMSKDIIKIASSQDDSQYNQNVKNLFGESTFQKDDNSADSKSVSLIMSNGTQLLQQMQLPVAYSYEKTFEITSVQSQEMALGILDGLLATDGDINLKSNHPQIRFVTSSEKLAQNIRRLSLMIGCHGRITKSFYDDGGTIDGRRIERKHPKYSVCLSGESARKFARHSLVKRLDPRKGELIQELRKNWMTTGNTWKAEIVSIEQAGTSKVYDLYCEGSDTWITDGYVQRGCGEQPLHPYDSCNLGSINLGKFVKKVGEHYEIDWERLRVTTHTATHLLDNVIDANKYPVKQIEEQSKKTRRIGLGVMGFADMLIRLGVKYDSEEGVRVGEQVMKFIHEESIKKSMEIAKVKGSFPAFKGSLWDRLGYPCMRNGTLTTVAPTGTIGIIADCSQGIEPLFAVSYLRNTQLTEGGMSFVEVNNVFEEVMRSRGLYTEELMSKIARAGSIQNIAEVPEDIKKVFVTTFDITNPEWHVKMQAAFQAHVDSSVSKTINMPNEVTPEEVDKAYWFAWKWGCKGITIYRDGSKSVQVLNVQRDPKETPKPTEHASYKSEEPIAHKGSEAPFKHWSETKK